MGDSRPTIPLGDALRRLKLPGWIRWFLDLFRGTRVQTGGVDILLDEDGRPISRGPLEQPHKPGPPMTGPPGRFR